MSNGGKGDKQRPVDRKRFDENWDRIFGKKDYVKGMVDSAIEKIDAIDIDELEAEFKSFGLDVVRKQPCKPQ